MRLLSIQHALIRNNMFIKSSKIFLPTCLFRPTCRVELDILLCKSTKKYPIIKFWMAFEQNWYPQLILCAISNIRRFKVLQLIPSIQHVYFIFKNIPTNMFIPSNMIIELGTMLLPICLFHPTLLFGTLEYHVRLNRALAVR